MYLGDRIPRFLAETERKRAAENVAAALSTASVEELRSRLSERIPILRELFNRAGFFHPLSSLNLGSIGSR
jgi:hypothetical protein